MSLTFDQQAALANQRRWEDLKRKEAKLVSRMDTVNQMIQNATNLSQSAGESLNEVRSQIAALESGAGQGLGDDYGPYSNLEQAMRTERFAGKQATLEYVKANPTCTEEEATVAYTTAALATRPPNRQYLIMVPHSLFLEYADTAVQAGYIPDTSWESFRDFVVVTPADVLMGL